jgi:prolyl-tRNA synthetase
LASVIEEHNDEDGIIWPATVAPYHVTIIPIKYDRKVKESADRLADELEKKGIEVLLDDRNERPGVKFNDADLTGIPWRVVIGDKGLANSVPQVEVKRRGEEENRMIDLDKAAAELAEKIREEIASLNS